MRRILWAAATGIGMFAATPALADVTVTAGDALQFQFVGTVVIDQPEQIVVRNPDGSTTTFPSDTLPAYLYNNGDSLTVNFAVDLSQSAFSNAACGGQFTLSAYAPSGCSVEATVTTPFGNLASGGTGGDSAPRISGLTLTRDANGNYGVDMPTGSYSMSYVEMNPYQYNSATGTLSGPSNIRCLNAFDCPNGSITGTSTSMSFGNILIAGDMGTYRPGTNVGYNAGSAGTFSLLGGWNFGGGTPPTDVPAPPVAILFGVAAIALSRRRLRKSA